MSLSRKTLILLYILLLSTFQSGAQNIEALRSQAPKIAAEGMRLYRSERASWVGTDMFMARQEDHGDIGGYLSYLRGDTSAVCIFYSRDEAAPKVIGTMIFDTSYSERTAIISLDKRDFNEEELILYNLRRIAKDRLTTDTIFRSYKNTQANAVPMIFNGERRVYILTGTPESDVVPLGNDYLLYFNKRNEVTSVEPLHRSLIMLDIAPKDSIGNVQQSVGAIHTHLPGFNPLITATDICTLLLYQPFTHWTQHTVVSETCMSIWIAKDNTITVISRKAMERIYKDQEKRH